MKTRLLTLACFCWLALTAFAEPIPAFTQYTWLFQTNATAAQARAYLGITGAGGSTNWIDIGGTNSTLSGIALIGTNAPPTGLSNTNTTVLWLNGGIGFNTNVVDGPAWGTNGAGMIYRHTGELAIDPGFVFRGHGYVFEDDATNWRLLITTNGVNVGQIHSPTYMPLNMLEVGSDVGGPPCGFLVGNDFVGKSNAPPNGAMIEGALKVYGDIYADVYRDAAGNVLLYNNIGGGYLELGQQTGSQEIHFWSFGADQMHLNSAGTLVMQGLNTIQTYGGITTPLISGPTNITLRANGTNWWLVSQAGTLLGLTGTETINAGGGASLGLANITNNLTFPGTNTAGLILRNLTTAQMNNLPTPPAGAMAFNTDSNRFMAWDGSAWHQRVRLDGDTMYGDLTAPNMLVTGNNTSSTNVATQSFVTNAINANTTPAANFVQSTNAAMYGNLPTVNGVPVLTNAPASSGVTNIVAGAGLSIREGSPQTTNATVDLNIPPNYQHSQASYAFSSNDFGTIVVLSNATAVAVSSPQGGTANFRKGTIFYLRNDGAGLVTYTPTSSLVNWLSTADFEQYQGGRITCDGTNYVLERFSTRSTPGGVLYGTTSAGGQKWSAALTQHGVVMGGGAGGSPTSSTAGTAGQVFTSNGAADGTFQGAPYCLILGNAGGTMAASATYYYGGAYAVGPESSEGRSSVIVPSTGTITALGWHVYGTASTDVTYSTNEVWLNNGSTGIKWQFLVNSFPQNAVITGLSQAVTAGDTLEVKITNTNYVSAPTSVRPIVTVFIH